MSTTCLSEFARVQRRTAVRVALAVCLAVGVSTASGARAETGLASPIIFTQILAESTRPSATGRGLLRQPSGERGRLVVLEPDSSARVLTAKFHSAADPAVSFDAKRILFAGKLKAGDPWNIFEMMLDGSGLRQITRGLGDCRSPSYQSMFYTIVSPEPWYQITFVSTAAAANNEYGPMPATDLYSCELDGSSVRRLTFNVSSDFDPVLTSDGRLLFSSWQRRTLGRGPLGRVALFGVGIDGTDYAAFCTDQGKRVKHMPCVTAGGLAVFVEADSIPWDGAGQLGSVQLRRPLHSYRPLTTGNDVLYHSPSPLPDGSILVSRRPRDGSATHGLYRFEPDSGKAGGIFDDTRYHEIQAQSIHARSLPDGRSSVVNEDDPHGKLYCLNVYTSDLKNRDWMPQGMVKRVRVLEGVPLKTTQAAIHGIPPLAPRRILAEAPVHPDGSFNVEVPANTPIELQILDEHGMALRSCGWIWAKNREPRGCIGCHEDGELTPENSFVDAMGGPSAVACPPVEKRTSVDFRRDVTPIIEKKCATCHREGEKSPRFDGGTALVKRADGRAHFNRAYESLLGPGVSHAKKASYRNYVMPGEARNSPVIWHIFGRNTSRPWDKTAGERPVEPMPPDDAPQLSAEEIQTFVRWVDLGASFQGTATIDGLPADARNRGGQPK